MGFVAYMLADDAVLGWELDDYLEGGEEVPQGEPFPLTCVISEVLSTGDAPSVETIKAWERSEREKLKEEIRIRAEEQARRRLAEAEERRWRRFCKEWVRIGLAAAAEEELVAREAARAAAEKREQREKTQLEAQRAVFRRDPEYQAMERKAAIYRNRRHLRKQQREQEWILRE